MKLNRAEQELRRRLIEHETPINTDELWANIEGDLDEKKNRKPFLIFWLIGVSIFTGIALLSYYWATEDIRLNTELDKILHHKVLKNNVLLPEMSAEDCPEFIDVVKEKVQQDILENKQNLASNTPFNLSLIHI